MDITKTFPLQKYPTLHKFALSDAKIKIVTGPAGCLPRETEVLTRNGWVSVSTAPTEILVYNPYSGEAMFDKVEPVSYHHPGWFHRFYTSHSMDMVVSDEHKIWYKTTYDIRRGVDAWHQVTGSELAAQWVGGSRKSARIPTTFGVKTESEYPLTDDQLRVCVMIALSGYFYTGGDTVRQLLRKPERVDKARELLSQFDIKFDECYHTLNGDEGILFTFYPPGWSIGLSRFYQCSQRQLEIIAEEVLFWATKMRDVGAFCDTHDKEVADFVQFALVSTGRPSVLTCDETGYLGVKKTYRVSCGMKGKTRLANMKTAKYQLVKSTDRKKYCFHTLTGMFVARHNGRVFCTGNSAKTSYMTMEILRRACMQAADHNGMRRTRILVGRNTYQILKSATIKTFMEMWGGFAQFKIGSFPMMAYLRIELPDRTKVECDVEFVSFDSEDSVSKLLGYEPTIVFFDEVSELPEDLIEAAASRVGRFPPKNNETGFAGATWSGVIGATNGPRKSHWLYDWYLGKKDDKFAMAEKASGRKQFELFFQPPALLRTMKGDWIPNPRAENIDNLADGYNYYFNMLTRKDADIQAYVEGRFADLVTGKLVFPQFLHHIHVVEHNKLNLSGGFPIYLSFDFGRTPYCAVATTFEGGSMVVIDEVMGEDMSIETLVNEHINPLLRQRYPKAWIEDAWGDPAGAVQTQAVDLSPYDVLRNNGIPVQNPDPSNRLEPRIEAVRQALQKLSTGGKPMLRVSDNCPVLIASLGSDYIYEQKRGTNGVVMDKPTKSHVNWVSEAADAVQYLMIGYNSATSIKSKRQKYAKLPKLNRKFL